MPSAKSVVISCAGTGSRLGLGTTKALLRVEGKSIIAWQLEMLREVEDVRVVVGFQAGEVVREVLKYRKDVIFVYNHSYFETKSGASFYFGAKDANEYVIAYNGDLLIHPDDARKLLSIEHEFTAFSEAASDDAVLVKLNEQGEVSGFSKKSGDYEWTGPSGLFKPRFKYTSGNFYNQLEDGLPLPGVKIRARDIDTYDDYLRAVEFVRSWRLD